MTDPRACPYCGAVLARRDNEQAGDFAARRFCGRSCSAAGVKRQLRDPIDRFIGHCRAQPTGCWLWQGHLTRSGYAQFLISRAKRMAAHRAAYVLFIGDIPEGMFVLHQCDTKACVNPFHLFLGTHADNMADMVQKGRSLRGERNPSAKLTARDVDSIRELLAAGSAFTEAAATFGVSSDTVSKIGKGLLWR